MVSQALASQRCPMAMALHAPRHAGARKAAFSAFSAAGKLSSVSYITDAAAMTASRPSRAVAVARASGAALAARAEISYIMIKPDGA